MAKRSIAQNERQDSQYRTNGRYARTNPCYACGKSAGVHYFSHPLTDGPEWRDTALVLCKRCADATNDMTDVKDFLDYKARFVDNNKKVINRKDLK